MQVEIMVPSLPTCDEIIDDLKRIDRAHIYTNYGPLFSEFRSKLEKFAEIKAGIQPRSAICSSGTTAIELALRARLGDTSGGLCLVPAFTFVATAHAVSNVGLEPYFLDVCPENFALTPAIVRAALPSMRERPRAVVVVSPFGGTVDIEAWEQFEREADIPVVIDLAAGITGLRYVGYQPICVSLHATKILGTGEGGAVLSTDRDMVDRIHAMTGFGFSAGSRTSSLRGGNYRISEYAAAIGLASLRGLDRRIGALQGILRMYEAALQGRPMRFQNGFGTEWIAMTLNILLGHEDVDAVLARFDEAGVQWRRWWSLGCHHHPAFSACGRGSLDSTDQVGKRLIGIPFHERLTSAQVDVVASCI